jgi:hypothetical protein
MNHCDSRCSSQLVCFAGIARIPDFPSQQHINHYISHPFPSSKLDYASALWHSLGRYWSQTLTFIFGFEGILSGSGMVFSLALYHLSIIQSSSSSQESLYEFATFFLRPQTFIIFLHALLDTHHFRMVCHDSFRRSTILLATILSTLLFAWSPIFCEFNIPCCILL